MDGGEKLFEQREGGTEEKPSIQSSLGAEELTKLAMEFLRSPNLLYMIKLLMEKGLVLDRYRFVLGEDDRKLLSFLIGVSARTRWPQSAWVTGSSGYGKDNLVKVAMALMPPGFVKKRDYLTGGGIRYGDRNYKVLYIPEFRRAIEREVRLTMKEDGGYAFEIAVNDPKTGEWTTQVEEIPAKTIMTTSADRLPSRQTLRRCWLISVDEGQELTRRINKRKADYAEGRVKPADQEEIAVVQRAIEILEDVDVVVPFAGELLSLAEWDRSKLDFLLDIIRVIAFIHQFQRPKEQGRVIATPADLYIALRIACPTLVSSLTELPDRLRGCLEGLPAPDEPGITSRELASKLGKAQSTVRGYLADLIDLGYAYEERAGRSKLYWRSGRSVELLNGVESRVQQLKWRKLALTAKRSSIRPSPESVDNSVGDILNVSNLVIDPITGKEVDLYELELPDFTPLPRLFDTRKHPPVQSSTVGEKEKKRRFGKKEPKMGEFVVDDRGSTHSTVEVEFLHDVDTSDESLPNLPSYQAILGYERRFMAGQHLELKPHEARTLVELGVVRVVEGEDLMGGKHPPPNVKGASWRSGHDASLRSRRPFANWRDQPAECENCLGVYPARSFCPVCGFCRTCCACN
jgi:DNA-binding transcriptional ArsR family regulator